MVVRISSLALAATSAALLAAAFPPEQAAAQSQSCKTESIEASGRAKFRPFSKTKELEGRGSAMADAVAKWEQNVGGRFGEQWKKWSNARNTSFDCAPTKSGKIIGSSFIACTITGRPCSTGGTERSNVVIEREADKRQRASIDGRRPDRGSRGVDWQARAQDRAYAREMRYQDYLARQRDRAEARAWARENAKQRYLAMQRTRAQQGYGGGSRRARRASG